MYYAEYVVRRVKAKTPGDGRLTGSGKKRGGARAYFFGGSGLEPIAALVLFTFLQQSSKIIEIKYVIKQKNIRKES